MSTNTYPVTNQTMSSLWVSSQIN
uniref:Uncharacterized protein n=1 Tax=Rhizophora mucronata TaxID=61149 RepID=A0A2P2NEA4_RHIMU